MPLYVYALQYIPLNSCLFCLLTWLLFYLFVKFFTNLFSVFGMLGNIASKTLFAIDLEVFYLSSVGFSVKELNVITSYTDTILYKPLLSSVKYQPKIA